MLSSAAKRRRSVFTWQCKRAAILKEHFHYSSDEQAFTETVLKAATALTTSLSEGEKKPVASEVGSGAPPSQVIGDGSNRGVVRPSLPRGERQWGLVKGSNWVLGGLPTKKGRGLCPPL